MNSQRWLFLLYLIISPILVAVSQAFILEFPPVTALTGSPYDPFPRIFYIPALTGLLLLATGAMATSILETLKRADIPAARGNVIRILAPLVFLYLFWFGINFSQRSVIMEYLNARHTQQLSMLGMFYLPGLPEIFPKLGFLPFYVILVLGVVGVLATIAQCYVILADRSR